MPQICDRPEELDTFDQIPYHIGETTAAPTVPTGMTAPSASAKKTPEADMGVEPKIGVFSPKMDGENKRKAYEQMDDLGGKTPLCLVQHPYLMAFLYGNHFA